MNIKNAIRTLLNPSLNIQRYAESSSRVSRFQYENKFILLLTLLIIGASNAQVYKAAKNVPGGKIRDNDFGYWNTSASHNGVLFFSTQVFYMDAKTTTFGKTDGSVTTILPQLTGSDSAWIADLIEFNGDYYAAGSFRKTAQNNFQGLWKFNGKFWDSVEGFSQFWVSRLSVLGDKLYAAGEDNAGKTCVIEIDKNGNTKNSLKYSKKWGTSYSFFLLSTKNKLYLINDRFNRYDGTKWDTVDFPNLFNNSVIIALNAGDTAVLFVSSKKLYEMNGNGKINLIDTIKMDGYLNCGVLQGNEIMFTGYDGQYVNIHYDLKTKTQSPLLGLNYFSYSSNNQVYTTLNEKDGPKNFLRIQKLTDGNSGVVQGRVFEDVNSNCTYNPGIDKTYAQMRGYFSNLTDTFAFFADDTGGYVTVLPIVAESYRVKVLNKYTTTSSVLCGDTPTISKSTFYNNNIPFAFVPSQKDVAIDVVGQLGWRARQGFEESYDLHYSNPGTTTEDVEIELLYPDSITFITSSISPKSHVGNKLVFERKGLKPREVNAIRITFKVSTQKSLGGKLAFVSKISTLSGDIDTTNNSDTLIQKVVAAVDPNIKTSLPEGRITKPVSLIKYHIHFQNMGTDTAYRVIVVDTFMPNFPLYKLQMTGKSHHYKLRVEPGNVLVWEFENIKLPAGTKDAVNNRGYISFEAPLSSPTKIGTVISNRAHIYFDYQKPVITEWNRVEHSEWGIGLHDIIWTTTQMKIIPNPVGKEFRVALPNETHGALIYDILGNVVDRQEQEASEYYFDAQNLKPGVYFIVAGEYKARMIKQ